MRSHVTVSTPFRINWRQHRTWLPNQLRRLRTGFALFACSPQLLPAWPENKLEQSCHISCSCTRIMICLVLLLVRSEVNRWRRCHLCETMVDEESRGKEITECEIEMDEIVVRAARCLCDLAKLTCLQRMWVNRRFALVNCWRVFCGRCWPRYYILNPMPGSGALFRASE